jgi:dTDP-D-glucose 4,6-dehydratase
LKTQQELAKMDKNHNLQYINSGRLGQDILKYVTKSTEKYVENLVKEKGISLTSTTLQKIYSFTEMYAKQITDTIASESLNDQDFNMNKQFINTNIYRP